MYRYIAIAVLALALTGMTKLWRNAANDLVEYKAQVVAAGEVFKQKQIDDAAASKDLIKRKDAEHAKDLDNMALGWATSIASLRDQYARSRKAPQPVRIVTDICDNEAGNLKLSEALSRAEQRVDDAMEHYQVGVARLLENANIDAIAREKVREWAEGEALINR